MRRLWSIAALAVLVLSACDPTGPGERDEEDLRFVRFTNDALPEVTQASFWAVHGQARTLVIRYSGQSESEPPLLELRVGPLSLLQHVNGAAVLPGDSVQITVNVDPQGRFLFDFQPAGLAFSPTFPALLRINYDRADPDLDRDGVVTQQDAALEASLRIWSQSVGLRWQPIPSVRLPGVEIFEGRVTHFTGFALAS